MAEAGAQKDFEMQAVLLWRTGPAAAGGGQNPPFKPTLPTSTDWTAQGLE